MRGADTFTESLFTMRHLEDFVPVNHPLRPIRVMVNAALVKMDALLGGMYDNAIKLSRARTLSIGFGRSERMKIFRRVATRPEKLDGMFLGFVHLAAIKKWLH